MKSQQYIIELVTRPGDAQVGGRDSLYFAVLVGDLAKVRWLVESGEVCADSRFYFRGESRHIMHIAIASGQERIGNYNQGEMIKQTHEDAHCTELYVNICFSLLQPGIWLTLDPTCTSEWSSGVLSTPLGWLLRTGCSLWRPTLSQFTK